MVSTITIAVIGLFGSGCRGKQEGRSLAETTASYCKDIETQLRKATTTYGDFAKAEDQLSDAQKQRDAMSLAFGLTLRERIISSLALHRDLRFCVDARNATAETLSALAAQVDKATQQLAEAPTTADVARRIEDLTAIAATINGLPMHD
jgi:hypothetical protein